MLRRHSLKDRLLLAAAVVGISTPVLAAPEGAAEQSGATIEELVVTAQRREQSLQDVPISLAVVTGDTLARQGMSDFSELQKLAPGLAFIGANNPRGAGIAIRGVGTVSFSEGIESSVGIVLDGVPIGRQGGGFTDLADLERIEVLRGPQGTLFGKNASAGVINIVTKRPTRSLSFNGLASYGENDDIKLRANVSGPLTADGALRGLLAGYFTHADGLIKDLNQDKTYNGRHEWGVRGKVEYDISDNLNLLVTADYSDRDAACCIWTVLSFAPGTNPPAKQYLDRAGVVVGLKNRSVILDGDVYQRQYTRGLAAELNWDLPQDLQLTSITAARGWHSVDNNDADQTPIDGLNLNYGSLNQRQYTQEFRLATPAGRTFEYVLGAFYFNQSTRSDINTRGTLFNATVLPGRVFGSSTIAKVNTENYAAFGDATWRISDNFRALGGARVTRETITFAQRIITSQGNLPYPGRPPATFKGDQSDTAVSWRAGLQYDVQDDVMVYATVARGYKGGGFNILVGNTTQPQPIAPEIPTNYEVGVKSTLFDRRVRLNASVFRTDFKNFQAQTLTVNPVSGSFVFDLKNAGKLRSQGAEVDLVVVPTEGLTLNAGVSYLDATFREFLNAPCYNGQRVVGVGCEQVGAGVFAQDLSGARLPNSPKWNLVLGGRYEHGVGDDLTGFVQANWSYRSTTNAQQSGDPNMILKGYGLFDAGVGVRHEAGWTLTLFAKNLFDHDYPERIIDTSLAAGTPNAVGSYSFYPAFTGRRTLGVQLELAY